MEAQAPTRGCALTFFAAGSAAIASYKLCSFGRPENTLFQPNTLGKMLFIQVCIAVSHQLMKA